MRLRISDRVPAFAGDDRRFNDGAVDRLERTVGAETAGEALLVEALQLGLDDLLIGAARRRFIGVVAASSKGVAAGVGVDVEREGRGERIHHLRIAGGHIGVAGHLTHQVVERCDLRPKLGLRGVDVIQCAAYAGKVQTCHTVSTLE